MPADPSPSDFVGPTADAVTESGASVPDGIYRVVGTTPESVTLLRVGDADGEREVTGTIYSVTRETYRESFESTNEPAGRGLLRAVAGRLTATGHLLLRPIYWLRGK